jgi:hypothetical protein
METIEIKVIDTDSIPYDILEAAILAQYDYVPSDFNYCSWWTSWRSSEGGNTICSNSPEHTALSHYLIKNGCGPDEKVVLSF